MIFWQPKERDTTHFEGFPAEAAFQLPDLDDYDMMNTAFSAVGS